MFGRFRTLPSGPLGSRRHRPLTSLARPAREPVQASGDAGRRPHVVHVVESLSSGVATALEDYVRRTPGCTHTVLAWRRSEAQTGDRLDELASDVRLIPRVLLAQARFVRPHVKRLHPDVVHAHSYYAGLYVRAFTPQTS